MLISALIFMIFDRYLSCPTIFL